MPRLDGATILSIWERGTAQFLGDRAVTLLELTDCSPAEASAMAIGRRDVALLQIRRRLFGDRIEAVTSCTACGEELDISLSVAELVRDLGSAAAQPFFVDLAGERLGFRVPNAGDLAALRGTSDVELGVKALIDRCLSADSREAAHALPAGLSSANIAALEDAFATADPVAEMRLVTQCPTCNEQSAALFDAPSFLWKEIEELANGVLWDIHALASAYGWDEQTILELTPVRRRFYLGALQT
jgi:hypothetical protein